MSNKLFFVALALLVILYVVALGGNAIDKPGDDIRADDEERQNEAARKFNKGGFIKSVENLLDPFAPRLDLVNLAHNCKTQEDRILLTPSKPSCTVAIPVAETEFRKATLTYSSPGPVSTRGGSAVDPAALRRFRPELAIDRRIRIPGLGRPIQGQGKELSITYKPNPPEDGGSSAAKSRTVQPSAGEPFKITVGPAGGLLTLDCPGCAGRGSTLTVRVE